MPASRISRLVNFGGKNNIFYFNFIIFVLVFFILCLLYLTKYIVHALQSKRELILFHSRFPHGSKHTRKNMTLDIKHIVEYIHIQ